LNGLLGLLRTLKDVIEEVAKEIASIWKSEYGGDRRRIVMGGEAWL
jgi:hypothetical protein